VSLATSATDVFARCVTVTCDRLLSARAIRGHVLSILRIASPAGGTTEAPWLLNSYEIAFWAVSKHGQRYADRSRRQSSIRFLPSAEERGGHRAGALSVTAAWPFLTTSTFSSYIYEGVDGRLVLDSSSYQLGEKRRYRSCK
jgi:hypothetical protein